MKPTADLTGDRPVALDRVSRGMRRGSPARKRIIGIDVARGLALVGMFGAHLGIAGENELTLRDPTTWLDVVNGRSSLLFALLAGVSLALMTAPARSAAPEQLRVIRLRLIGRGAVVFVIGLAVELIGTEIAVILTLYGVLYVIAAATVHLRTRVLLIAAGTLAIVGPPMLALTAALSFASIEAPGLGLVLFGAYPITVWMALLFTGLVIGRLDLTRTRTAIVMLVCGALVALGGQALGEVLIPAVPVVDEGVPQLPGRDVDISEMLCAPEDDAFLCYPAVAKADPTYVEQVLAHDPGTKMLSSIIAVGPHTGGVLEILSSGGFAIAVLGLCLLLARFARWMIVPLAAYGSMPLTGYVVQAILLLFAAYDWWPDVVATWIVLSLAMMVAAIIWMRMVGKGPLERLTAHAADKMALTAATRSGEEGATRFDP